MNLIFSSKRLMMFCSAAVCVVTKKTSAPEISCSFSKHAGSSQDPAPIISVPTQRRLSHNGFSTSSREEVTDEASAPPFTDQPIFFRSVIKKLNYLITWIPSSIALNGCLSNQSQSFLSPMVSWLFLSNDREFRFTSEVPIRLDYHGKHVSMEQVCGLSAFCINSTLCYCCFMNNKTLLSFREHLQASLLGWHSWIVQSWSWGGCATDKGMLILCEALLFTVCRYLSHTTTHDVSNINWPKSKPLKLVFQIVRCG